MPKATMPKQGYGAPSTVKPMVPKAAPNKATPRPSPSSRTRIV